MPKVKTNSSAKKRFKVQHRQDHISKNLSSVTFLQKNLQSVKELYVKSTIGQQPRDFWRKALLRFVDFFVRMWRLKDFWYVILPVPVTLKRFLALELFFTFGIIIFLRLLPAGVSALAELLLSLTGIKFGSAS